MSDLSPGQQLAQAREALAMSIDDVCRELKTMASQIKAIEEDRFNDLPGDAFVRGYLRGYAVLVGLNGDDIVAQYKELRGDDAQLVGTEPEPHVVWPKQLAVVVVLGAVLGAAAVGVFKAYEYYSREPVPVVAVNSDDDDQFVSPQVSVTQSAETQANADQALDRSAFEPALDKIDLEQAASETQQQTDAELAMMMTEDGNIAVDNSSGIQVVGDGDQISDVDADVEQSLVEADDSIEDAPRVIGSGRDELMLTFTDKSWVRVRDEQTLDLLLNEVIDAGRVVRVRHTGPLDIRLGYAPGVQVRFNGEPVSFTIRAGSNTAKLIVGGQ